MTIHDWLEKTTIELSNVGIETARLDALVILCDVLGKDKSWILAYSEQNLQGSDLHKLNTKIDQRTTHVPLAYIRGQAEFYGREFMVSEAVLVPRPESESMIELLKKVVGRRASGVGIIDVGTGGGCLAITAKLELPDASVVAIDIDEDALRVAVQNAHIFDADVQFYQGDLLQPLLSSVFKHQPSFILANLPYVPTNYPINEAAAHEPALALFSGDDGLDHYRKLFEQAMELAPQPYAIIAESLFTQHKKMNDLATNAGYEQKEVDGLVQLFVLR